MKFQSFAHIAAKFSNIFKRFYIVFEYFYIVFEYFRTFSNVFERFRTFLTETCAVWFYPTLPILPKMVSLSNQIPHLKPSALVTIPCLLYAKRCFVNT